ncbi:hypothetical protein [Streptomyces lavendulae]|nr:hypothetical protein [Streptomyces lavendulae]
MARFYATLLGAEIGSAEGERTTRRRYADPAGHAFVLAAPGVPAG